MPAASEYGAGWPDTGAGGGLCTVRVYGRHSTGTEEGRAAVYVPRSAGKQSLQGSVASVPQLSFWAQLHRSRQSSPPAIANQVPRLKQQPAERC